MDVAQVAAAAVDGLNVAVFSGEGKGLVDVVFDARKVFEELLDDLG